MEGGAECGGCVVRALWESGHDEVESVRIEYLWCAVCSTHVEAAPTRVPTAAGGGVWGGVCEGGGSELSNDQCRIKRRFAYN